MRIVVKKKIPSPPLQLKKKINKKSNVQMQQKIPIQQSNESFCQNIQKQDLLLNEDQQFQDFSTQYCLNEMLEQFKIINLEFLEYCLNDYQLQKRRRRFLQINLEKIGQSFPSDILQNNLLVLSDSLTQLYEFVQLNYDQILSLSKKECQNTLKLFLDMLSILTPVNSFLCSQIFDIFFYSDSRDLKTKTYIHLIETNSKRIPLMIDDFVYFKEIQQAISNQKQRDFLIYEYYIYQEQKLLDSQQINTQACIIEKSFENDVSNQQDSEQNKKLFQQNQDVQFQNFQENKFNNMQNKICGNNQNNFKLTCCNQQNQEQNLGVQKPPQDQCLKIQENDHVFQNNKKKSSSENKQNKLKQSLCTTVNSSTAPQKFSQIKEHESKISQIPLENKNIQLQITFDKMQQQEIFNEVTVIKNPSYQSYINKTLIFEENSQQHNKHIPTSKSQEGVKRRLSKIKIVNLHKKSQKNSSVLEKVNCQEKDHSSNFSSKDKSTEQKKDSFQKNLNVERNENNQSQIQQASQQSNNQLNKQKTKSNEEDDIQNISFEEKLYQANEELNKKILLEFQQHQREKIIQKHQKIMTQIKKFRELKTSQKSNFLELDEEEEDISEVYDELLDSYFKVGSVLFQLQTEQLIKIHTVSISELFFFDSLNHASISCDMKAYVTQLNKFSLLDEITRSQEINQQQDQKNIPNNIQIEKIDFGEESISQVSFITSKSLLIFLSNNNQLLIFKYSHSEQQIILEQIIKHKQQLLFECWTYLNGYDIIVTDGNNNLQFWKIKLNQQDIQQNAEDFESIIQDTPIYTIDHTLSDTALCFYEEKSIIFQAGFRSIIQYSVQFNQETKQINHQTMENLNCQAQGHINTIQIIKKNQVSHFLLSLHNKNKIILWSIHHLNQQYVYSINISDQINQIIFNPLINTFFLLIDCNLSSDIVILDQYLQNVNFPKKHQKLKAQNCKITRFSISPEMNKLSIGYENGLLQFLDISILKN